MIQNMRGFCSKLEAKKVATLLGFTTCHDIGNGRFMPGPSKAILEDRLQELLEESKND